MSSVHENNSFEKSALISDEYRNSEKRTNLEQQRMHTSSVQCSLSFKIVGSSIVDSINNKTIEKEFTSQDSSDRLNYYELPELKKKIKCKIKR